MRKLLALLPILLMMSFSASAQKSSTYIGTIDGKDLRATFELHSGESTGSFVITSQAADSYQMTTVTKNDQEIEIRITLNSTKYSSGTLVKSLKDGKVRLEGNMTKADGTTSLLVLIEE